MSRVGFQVLNSNADEKLPQKLNDRSDEMGSLPEESDPFGVACRGNGYMSRVGFHSESVTDGYMFLLFIYIYLGIVSSMISLYVPALPGRLT